MGFTNVHFEVDSKGVVDELFSTRENFTEFGVIVDHCKSLISSFTNFSTKLIRKQANKVAHSLARAAVLYASSQCFHIAPSCIADIILNELP